jgi:hypothetical protein
MTPLMLELRPFVAWPWVNLILLYSIWKGKFLINNILRIYNGSLAGFGF